MSVPAAQYRAELDFEITFSNGGGLRGEGFRIDIADPGLTVDELGTALVADLGLLMADRVEIRGYRILSERHKRAVPASRGAPGASGTPLHRADLSHPIEQGMITIPGLADLDGLVVDVTGAAGRAIGQAHFVPYPVEGKAVLVRTGWDRHWGTGAYAGDHPFLTAEAAAYLASSGARLVGIDAINIDDTADPERPAHSRLLAAGIPVCEHLTNLGELPGSGFRFSAVPPRVAGFGTFPVRAFASWDAAR